MTKLKDLEIKSLEIKDLEIKDFTKPILKWVGGKQKFIKDILNEFPSEMNNYHELFLGGGSVLLGLLDYKNKNIIEVKGKMFAYDFNKDLIYVYKNIQDNPKKLFTELKKIKKEFLDIEKEKQAEDYKKEERKKNRKYIPMNIGEAKVDRESYYYWIRKQFNNMTEENKISIIGSVMFIFLNKTGFRGLYRIGPSGFNVPYGNYKNPDILLESHLLGVSKLIKDVEFIHCDFTESIKKIKENDFAYLDPPYAPEKKDSFTTYTKEGFNLDKHIELFSLCNKLGNKKFVMSNSSVKLVLDNFKQYNIKTIEVRRAINSKKPGSTTKEVLISNF
jgi:DNA adenine methylase